MRTKVELELGLLHNIFGLVNIPVVILNKAREILFISEEGGRHLGLDQLSSGMEKN